MNLSGLAYRGLRQYWRTHLAVVVGVATAVAVLSGALLVGDSVRGSLRDLVISRLGNTGHVLVSTGYFREALADDVVSSDAFDRTFDGVVPMVVTEGSVTMQVGSGRAGNVQVYGVDDRFWSFHAIDVAAPVGREALLSPALAEQLGAVEGETLLVRVRRPTDVPIESVFGTKDDLGQTIRVTVRETLPAAMLGEFSLSPRQGEVPALFVPLFRLQEDLGIAGKVNAVLVSGGSGDPDATAVLASIVRTEATLGDMGLRLRQLDPSGLVSLEADDGLIDDAVAQAAAGIPTTTAAAFPYFTYLANTIRIGDRTVPYSLVTGTDFFQLGLSQVELATPPPILLNEWAMSDLGAEAGDTVTLEYYVWEEPGRLVTSSMDFELAGSFPVESADPDLAPDYPGVSDSPNLADWDPPFPIDLARIRPQDEEYWEDYGTTPKAFIPFDVARTLWSSRYGSMTSIRFATTSNQTPETALNSLVAGLGAELDPLEAGMALVDVRAQGLRSSSGAVDFGQYFVYFSFFIVVAALMLTVLFFKLGVEQRIREVGLLRAVGFRPGEVRGLFLREGAFLAIGGTAIGVVGGLAYAGGIVRALGTWWIGAVGTRALELHVTIPSLAGGAIGGILAAIAAIAITLRGLARVSERDLLAAELRSDSWDPKSGRGLAWTALGAGASAAVLLAATTIGFVPEAVGFFGSGFALLATALVFYTWWFGRPGAGTIRRGAWATARLGLRNVAHRPSRSALSVGMIAAATFILISVDAFRKSPTPEDGPASGLGGYSVVVESLIPLVADFDGAGGREFVGLSGFDDAAIAPFRLRPGDDASCLNLYTPENPRIIAPTDAFIEEGRFRFADSVASNPSEQANPWTLLRRTEPDGAIPVIGDANSLAYVLHKDLGEDIVISEGGREIRLRVVAALADSIFQGELIMSESNFRDVFPTREGYSYLLVSTGAPAPEVVDSIEFALEDYGADATSTADRLLAFHQVENTYLSTFQALGGLGLLVGTVGLGAILMRNVLERRKEMALMRALGFETPDFFSMVIAENTVLLAIGIVTGAVSAAVAILPALAGEGGRLPSGFLLVLLGGVMAAGLITSFLATVAALGSPVLAALRSE